MRPMPGLKTRPTYRLPRLSLSHFFHRYPRAGLRIIDSMPGHVFCWRATVKHSIALIFLVALAMTFSVMPNPARAQVGASPIAGAWTLNADLTDKPDQSTQPDGG